MSNYSMSLELTKIPSSFLADIQGKNEKKKCVCIPVDALGLFEGKKGIYLDLNIYERKEKGEYGDTHFASISIPSDTFKAMSEEERKAIPIVASLKPIESKKAECEIKVQDVEANTEGDMPF